MQPFRRHADLPDDRAPDIDVRYERALSLALGPTPLTSEELVRSSHFQSVAFGMLCGDSYVPKKKDSASQLSPLVFLVAPRESNNGLKALWNLNLHILLYGNAPKYAPLLNSLGTPGARHVPILT